jgi:hypothetical protein
VLNLRQLRDKYCDAIRCVTRHHVSLLRNNNIIANNVSAQRCSSTICSMYVLCDSVSFPCWLFGWSAPMRAVAYKHYTSNEFYNNSSTKCTTTTTTTTTHTVQSVQTLRHMRVCSLCTCLLVYTEACCSCYRVLYSCAPVAVSVLIRVNLISKSDTFIPGPHNGSIYGCSSLNGHFGCCE